MRILLSILATVFVVCISPLHGQSLMPDTGTDPDPAVALRDGPLSTDEANALLSRLSDAEVRALLLDQLNAQATEANADVTAGRSEFVYHATTGAVTAITAPIERLPILLERQAAAFSNFSTQLGDGGVLRFLLLFAATLVVAGIAEFAFRRATRRWHELAPPDPNHAITLRQTLGSLFQRLCRDVLAVFVFIIAAIIASRIIIPLEMQPFSSLIGPNLIALPRLAWAVGRFFMAPDNPAYRILNITDENAKRALFHQVCLAVLVGLGGFLPQFNALNGVPMGETRLGFWLNFAVHAYIAFLFWRFREPLTQMMRGTSEVTPYEDRAARLFPIFGVIAAIATWWMVNIMVSYGNFELLAQAPHYVTLGLLLFAPAIDTGVRGLVRHIVPPMSGTGPVAEHAHYATHRSYIRIGRVIVFGLVLITIANVWGLDWEELAAAGVGERIAARSFEFLMILSIGYLVYEIASLQINRKLAAEITATGYDPENADFGGDGGGAGGSRLSTVLPLILFVVRIAIIVVFLLLALGNVGIDTTPLLAGAGIVGLAIGFGAQKLVADVVSGIFFLIDDAFRTGEYVEIEGTMGTVEKISLRSMQLRHHKGPVHTLPYGEIPKITNFSRDWVIMKLRFTVPFETDPNQIKKIFKKIGADMLEHPELGQDFLQPFKSQGVLEIDDVGMVIRGKFMAKPGKQFMIRKEIFNRVSAAFAENGIDFARREVRVALPGLEGREELTEEDKSAIAAAASQAAQEQADATSTKDDR